MRKHARVRPFRRWPGKTGPVWDLDGSLQQPSVSDVPGLRFYTDLAVSMPLIHHPPLILGMRRSRNPLALGNRWRNRGNTALAAVAILHRIYHALDSAVYPSSNCWLEP